MRRSDWAAALAAAAAACGIAGRWAAAGGSDEGEAEAAAGLETESLAISSNTLSALDFSAVGGEGEVWSALLELDAAAFGEGGMGDCLAGAPPLRLGGEGDGPPNLGALKGGGDIIPPYIPAGGGWKPTEPCADD